MSTCFICNEALPKSEPIRGDHYDCIRCGVVRITSSLASEIKNHIHDEKLHLLSGMLCELTFVKETTSYPAISTDTLDNFLKSPLIPQDLDAQLDKFLFYLKKYSTEFGKKIKIPDQRLPAIFYCKSLNETGPLRGELPRGGLIEIGSFDSAGRNYILTKKGLDRLKEKSLTLQKRPEKNLMAFVSYSSHDKVIAGKIKSILDGFHIDAFLAHDDDDIGAAEDWKKSIVDAIKQSEIFIPLLSSQFIASKWGPQEIGIAYGKTDVLIIPLSIDGMLPFGFIDHVQAKPIGGTTGIPLDYLIKPIVNKFPTRMIQPVIDDLKLAGSFRGAESVMNLLVPHYEIFNQEQIDLFVTHSIENGQIWDAGKCANEYIPKFIELFQEKIESQKLKALRFQIQNRQVYRAKEASDT